MSERSKKWLEEWNKKLGRQNKKKQKDYTANKSSLPLPANKAKY